MDGHHEIVGDLTVGDRAKDGVLRRWSTKVLSDDSQDTHKSKLRHRLVSDRLLYRSSFPAILTAEKTLASDYDHTGFY